MPVAFINTISKSGTHLAMQYVSLLPGMGRGAVCCGPHPYLSPEHSARQLQRTLRDLGPSGYFCGHIRYFSWLSTILQTADIRTIVVIRDPRDVLVSTALWIDAYKEHTLYSRFRAIPDFFDKLLLLLHGIPATDRMAIEIPPFACHYKRFLEWRQQPKLLMVRYESLAGEAKGGTTKEQYNQISLIARHLDVNCTRKDIRHIADAVQMCANAYERNGQNKLRGVIGLWRNVCLTHEQARLLNQCLDSSLRDWGYE